MYIYKQDENYRKCLKLAVSNTFVLLYKFQNLHQQIRLAQVGLIFCSK